LRQSPCRLQRDLHLGPHASFEGHVPNASRLMSAPRIALLGFSIE